MHIDWTNIIVAGFALVGSAYGSYKGKDKIVALLDFRLKELEKKQDKHNNLIDRMYDLENKHIGCKSVLEEKVKVINHRIDDLEEELKK